MEKDSKTTVAVERTTFAKLDRLAKANSVSKMEYITHAINYFEKYGINPVEHESPAQEMQKLIKRMDQVFAFLKKQETDLVRPACEALAGASTQITISLSSLLSEEKFRRFLKDNKVTGRIFSESVKPHLTSAQGMTGHRNRPSTTSIP